MDTTSHVWRNSRQFVWTHSLTSVGIDSCTSKTIRYQHIVHCVDAMINDWAASLTRMVRLTCVQITMILDPFRSLSLSQPVLPTLLFISYRMGGCASALPHHYDASVAVQRDLVEICRVYAHMGTLDPRTLIKHLLQMNSREMRNVTILPDTLKLVQERFVKNPRCAAHQILYEVCQGLCEWQLSKEMKRTRGVSPPPVISRLPPSKFLHPLPSPPNDDFRAWIQEVDGQLGERLATCLTIHRRPLLEILESLQASKHPERFNMLHPKFLEYLFSAHLETLQKLQPMCSILMKQMEATEVIAPGTFAPLITRLLYSPLISEHRSIVAQLYCICFKYQSPPEPDKLVHERTGQFLDSFIWTTLDSGLITQMIEMVLRYDLREMDSSDRAQTSAGNDMSQGSSSSPLPLVSGNVWNRPTLLPGVTRRAFIHSVEERIIPLRDIRRLLGNWWISTSWCSEEVCWPLEMLERMRVIANRGGKEELKLPSQDWILAAEAKHWSEIIGPIVTVFDESTSLHPDIVMHEILPFLRASPKPHV